MPNQHTSKGIIGAAAVAPKPTEEEASQTPPNDPPTSAGDPAVSDPPKTTGPVNQTVHHQTEDAPYRGRKKFKFDPDRHYCWLELPNKDWDSDAIDNLLDEVDPKSGEPAYRVEADGSTEEGRRITGSRRKIWLSCTQEYANRKAAENSNASREQARAITSGEIKREEHDLTGGRHELVEYETLQEKKAVPLKGIIGG
jgi:hypothetical protein